MRCLLTRAANLPHSFLRGGKDGTSTGVTLADGRFLGPRVARAEKDLNASTVSDGIVRDFSSPFCMTTDIESLLGSVVSPSRGGPDPSKST